MVESGHDDEGKIVGPWAERMIDEPAREAILRALSDILRRTRVASGRMLTTLAEECGVSAPELSRIETFKRLPRINTLLAICAALGVRPSEVLQAAESSGVPLPAQDHPGTFYSALEKIESYIESQRKIVTSGGVRVIHHSNTMDDEFGTVMLYESETTLLDAYSPTLIPTLLQTVDYARAVLVESDICDSASVEHRLTCLEQRQAAIGTETCRVWNFYIHENAIQTPVGDNLLMSEQMYHLWRLATASGVSIRIVPRSARGAGLARNEFERLRFAGRSRPPVVLVDLESNEMVLDRLADVSRYNVLLHRLDSVALGRDESLMILERLADEFNGVSLTTWPKITDLTEGDGAGR